MRKLLLAAALALPTAAVANDPWVVYPVDGSFEDAAFDLETTIEGRGLVIDSVSHVGDMLARTGPDVGSEIDLFEHADVFQFCSAVVSRQVMEANPMNIAYCPYGIFLMQLAGEEQVRSGYRRFPPGDMAAVERLIGSIVREVAGVE